MTSRSLFTQSLHVFLANSRNDAENNFQKLSNDLIFYSYNNAIREMWTEVLNYAQKLIRYIKYCQEEEERGIPLYYLVSGLHVIDTTQEALLQNINNVQNYGRTEVNLTYNSSFLLDFSINALLAER